MNFVTWYYAEQMPGVMVEKNFYNKCFNLFVYLPLNPLYFISLCSGIRTVCCAFIMHFYCSICKVQCLLHKFLILTTVFV